MPTYRAHHIVQGKNGTTKDTYVNTFHFFHPTALITDLAPNSQPWGDALSASLDDFWNGADSNGRTTIEYMSPRFGGNAIVKFYDMADPPNTGAKYVSGVPFYGPPDIQSLPEECAVCLSYVAINSGFNRPRRRGRIYIGPLNVAAMDELVDNDQPVRVNPALQQHLVEAGQALAAAVGGAGWKYRVFSQMDGFGFDIHQFSVDDAFDTIRGRGTAPSGRVQGGYGPW